MCRSSAQSCEKAIETKTRQKTKIEIGEQQMRQVEMKCKFCEKTIMVDESHKNAEVSHMDCAFVSLENVRKILHKE
jgi:hypothetical protein